MSNEGEDPKEDLSSIPSSSQAFPGLAQLQALDHSNPFLSPSQAAHFDVDGFLVSRTAGSTLGQITDDLRQFAVRLRNELDEVVDRDYRGFVNLGVALKAERPRIARLDWKGARDDGERKQGIDADGGNGASPLDDGWAADGDSSFPRGAGGNLGLERVRLDVVSIRDRLRNTQNAVQSIISRREAAEAERSNLQILLNFTDSLARLESLLLPQNAANANDDDLLESESAAKGNGAAQDFWRAFDPSEEDGQSEAESSDSLSSSDDETIHSASKKRNFDVKDRLPSIVADKRAPRRPSRTSQARRRSSVALVNLTSSAIASSSRPVLTLPSRIARASSEHSALVFLAEQTKALGHQEFVEAHGERLSQVRHSLEADLRSLVATLTDIKGDSLLVNDDQSVNMAHYRTTDLASWSQISNGTLGELRSEQMSWLELALATWTELWQSSQLSDQRTSAYGAEEVVRQSLVEPWTKTHITPSVLSGRAPASPKTPKTPNMLGTFANPREEEEQSINRESPADASALDNILLTSDEHGANRESASKGKPLVDLYNDVLRFVAGKTQHVSSAAANVIEERRLKRGRRQTNQDPSGIDLERTEKEGGECDVYVRAIWQEIGTQLMERIGGQLFFVGRPEDFRRNYTISMAFLASFERLAPSPQAVETLREDAVYLAFRKRWQLSVYFQMRLRDIVTTLESSLASHNGSHFGNAMNGDTQSVTLPTMPFTKAAVKAFSAQWTPDSHIRELSHRQWRLSLQIVSRFRSWIQEELPLDVLPAHRRVVQSGRATPSRSSFEQQRAQSSVPSNVNSNHGSNVGSPTRANTPTSSQTDVDGDNHMISVCTAITADVLWFDAQVSEALEKVIVPLLVSKAEQDPSTQQSVTNTLRTTLQESLQLFHSEIIPLLMNKVTSILKSRSSEPLRLVRSVSTQYRSATNIKGSASSVEPSFFVNQFLRPIRHYLGMAEPGSNRQPSSTSALSTLSGSLPKQVREQWIGDVLEDFVTRYTASLHTMSKNFESLQRLKRVNAGSSGGAESGAGNLDEADRMHGQMMADVAQLEREVQDLQSVQTDIRTDTPAWRKLKAAARGDESEEF